MPTNPTTRPLRATAVVAFVAAAATLASCSAGGADAETREVSMTLATPTWNAGIASIAVSEGEGYFADEGLDMEVVLTDSATTQLTQVATGNIIRPVRSARNR